jgi:hypothetical protein
MAQKEVYQHNDRLYELFTVEFPQGARQQIYFNITEYFKKP